jgi:hypothetical protein
VNKAEPISRSKELMIRESEGCEILRSPAALLMLPNSTTRKKNSIDLDSIALNEI